MLPRRKEVLPPAPPGTGPRGKTADCEGHRGRRRKEKECPREDQLLLQHPREWTPGTEGVVASPQKNSRDAEPLVRRVCPGGEVHQREEQPAAVLAPSCWRCHGAGQSVAATL